MREKQRCGSGVPPSKKPPGEGRQQLHIIVRNGLLLGISIFVLVFPRERCLAVAFFHARFLVIRLAVLGHWDHLAFGSMAVLSADGS